MLGGNRHVISIARNVRKSRIVALRCPGATKQGQKLQLYRTKPHEGLQQVRSEPNRALIGAGACLPKSLRGQEVFFLVGCQLPTASISLMGRFRILRVPACQSSLKMTSPRTSHVIGASRRPTRRIVATCSTNGQLATMRRGRSPTPRERLADGSEPSAESLEVYLEKWISRFAVFGDSVTAVVVTFLVMCLAIYMTTYSGAAHQKRPERINSLYDESRPIHAVYTINRTHDGYVAALSNEVRESFLRDGVVAIRGLVRPTLVDGVLKESATLLNPKPRKGAQFHTANHNSLFLSEALWQVAAESDIPAVAFQLLQHELSSATSDNLEPPTRNVTTLRIMRDIFLAKSSDDSYICGWHVDDLGFWPATPDSPGINAWIALEHDQTSFALAVGSHRAPWRHRAYHETGAPHGFPPGGYGNASDYLTHRTGSGTCNIKKAAPDLHHLMEESSRVYTLQPGDVILHTRWLFHRTVVSARTNDSAFKGKDPHRRMERRYSVRYGPGSSVIPPGYGTELSVLWDPSNGGRTADEVCANDGPWYPAVWPGVLERERVAMPGLVRDKLPVAAQRRKARESEMAPLVRQIARERSGSLLPR